MQTRGGGIAFTVTWHFISHRQRFGQLSYCLVVSMKVSSSPRDLWCSDRGIFLVTSRTTTLLLPLFSWITVQLSPAWPDAGALWALQTCFLAVATALSLSSPGRSFDPKHLIVALICSTSCNALFRQMWPLKIRSSPFITQMDSGKDVEPSQS